MGDRVKRLRQDKGWNQSQLARECGGNVKPQNIQQLEDGTVRQPRYLRRLAEALSISEKYLLTGDEPSSQNAGAPRSATDSELHIPPHLSPEKVRLIQAITDSDDSFSDALAGAMADLIRSSGRDKPPST